MLHNMLSRIQWNNRIWLEQTGGLLLLVAGVVVALAIIADGAFAKTVNGVGGIAWVLAAVFLVRSQKGRAGFGVRLVAVIAIGLFLVTVTKPSDFAWAFAGFGVAGAAVALVLPVNSAVVWAKILPALWLPEHLAVAAVRALIETLRDEPAHVRTSPPPTAALVPLAMIVAAWGAALIVTAIRQRSVTRSSFS